MHQKDLKQSGFKINSHHENNQNICHTFEHTKPFHTIINVSIF
jgi:hypothetical protein